MTIAISPDGAGDLVAAIAKVAAGIGWMAKGGTNSNLKYKFLEESQVVAEFAHPLAKDGIIFLPEVLDDQFQELGETKSGSIMWLTRLKVAFTITDGVQWVRVVTVGYGTDTGDKGGSKAMTMAKKYAMMIVAAIAQGDDPEEGRADESDGTGGARRRRSRQPVEEEAPPPRARRTRAAAPAEEEAPEPPARRRRRSAKPAEDEEPATTKQKQRMFGMANKRELEETELRELVLEATGKHSLKDCSMDDMDLIYAALDDPAALAKVKKTSIESQEEFLAGLEDK